MYADAGVNATDGTVINSTQENAAASNSQLRGEFKILFFGFVFLPAHEGEKSQFQIISPLPLSPHQQRRRLGLLR